MNNKRILIALFVLTAIILSACGDIVIKVPDSGANSSGGSSSGGNNDSGSSSNSNPVRAPRLIIITGEGRLTDDEYFSDEHATMVINERTTLSESNPRYTFPVFVKCAGGEVRVEMAITVTLTSNDSIDVNGIAELYEGGSCNTTDKEDTANLTGSVQAGGSSDWNFTLQNRGTGGGDKAEISFRIENYQQ